MKKKEAIAFISIFAKHGGEESSHPYNAQEHEEAKNFFINHGLEFIDILFQTIEDWVNLSSIMDLENLEKEVFSSGEELSKKIQVAYTKGKNNSITSAVEEYNKKKCVNDYAKIIFSENIVADVAEILGVIGKKTSIPYLKKMLNGNYRMGITALNAAASLIKLSDKSGVDFLKKQIQNPYIHRDIRIRSAKILIDLGIKAVFNQAEIVDCSGDSMSTKWSSELNRLIDLLR